MTLGAPLELDLKTAIVVLAITAVVFAIILVWLMRPKLSRLLKGVVQAIGWLVARALEVGFVGLFLVLAALTATEEVKPEAAGVAAGILLAAGVLAALGASGRGSLLSRLGKASIGPFGLEFVSEAKQAAGQTLPAEPDPAEVKEDDRSVPKDLITLRLRLEAKMAYIAKNLLAEDGHATFVTIGSLQYDGFLTDQEARTATRVLTLRDEELDALDPSVKRTFLVSATRLVNNIRASVHYGRVRRLLEDKKWTVLELPRGRARPDLWTEKNNRRYRIVPRFAMEENSENLTEPRKRLRENALLPRVRQRLIVIPDNSDDSNVTPSDENPRVVKFSDLLTAVKA